MEEKRKCVYLHLRKSNGIPFYVGQGTETRPYYAFKSSRGKEWTEIVEEEGGFTVQIIATNLTKNEANEIETSEIQKWGRIQDGGPLINKSLGQGLAGMQQTYEHRRKRSEAMKGKNLGRKYSDEAKAKIAEASRKMWERRKANGN